MNEIPRRIWWLLAAAVMAVALILTAVQAGSTGLWEPWESATLRIAVDGADGPAEMPVIVGEEAEEAQIEEAETEETEEEVEEAEEAEEVAGIEVVDAGAIPTLGGEPVAVSWIRTSALSMLVEDRPVVEAGGIGSVERKVRFPLMVVALLFLGATALWVRRFAGDGAAAATVMILVTVPVFYLGSIFLSGPLIYVAASALSMMAFLLAVYADQRRRILWALAGAMPMAIVALDERVIGVYTVLAGLVALAAAQTVGEAQRDSESDSKRGAGLDVRWLAATALACLGALYWGWSGSGGYEDGLFRPDMAQKLWLIAPVILLVGVAGAARKSAVGQALFGIRGLLFITGAILPLAYMVSVYGGAVSVGADMAQTKIPVLTYLLESEVFGSEIAAAGDFSWWWRQVGFGLFPHVMFLLPALGYLAWKLRPESESTEEERALATLCLVWPAAAFVVVAPAASLGHTVFPAFFAFVVALGWMISDQKFWKGLRLEPMTYLAIAIVAIFAVMILAKDFENFPSRLVEFVIGGDEGLALPDDFAYGDLLSRWKYLVVALTATYFAGAVSWAVFGLRDAKSLKNWVFARVKNFRNRKKKDGAGSAQEQSSPEDQEQVSAASAGQRRMKEREEWRDEEGRLSWVARIAERQPGLIALILVAGLGFMGAIFVSFLGDLDTRHSSRAVAERYLELAEPGQPLFRYRVDEDDFNFYVRGLESISHQRDFNQRYGGEERIFALIPEDRLAATHSEVRRAHAENLVVLARGGGILLVSNQLGEEEVDENPISEFIIDDEDEEDFIALFFDDGDDEVHLNFDRQIELIGYRLDRGSAEERAVYKWGEEMEIVMYFRVLRRIPRAQRIFMHIDFPGNRIHGDHEPVGGNYPTNHWTTGDIVKNVHRVEIDRFSAPGVYTIWAGFYRGDDRMSVRPPSAHDGENRVEVTKIEVVAF